MTSGSGPPPNTSVTVVGLGPAGLERVSAPARSVIEDLSRRLIVRTAHHPAVQQLAELRPLTACDDLYESGDDFDAVYAAIADRVLEAARRGPVVYAVPGSAVVGERAVQMIREGSVGAAIEVQVIAGESFLDLVYERVGLDPIAHGVQIVDGRDMPDPLPLHLPTIVTQVDTAVVLGDVLTLLGRTLPHDTALTVLDQLGSTDETVVETTIAEAMRHVPGPRTSLYLDPPPTGWHGLVVTNRRLRRECPWDREQTHHSLLSHLIEETYETVEAISVLPADAPSGDVDHGAYAELEEELGDLLLQVVFHATLAREAGSFDVEEVAEGIRRKLVRRHPHVFGEVEVSGAREVVANWEAIKTVEKDRASLMDDIPTALPGMARADKIQRRAASVGFDWPEAAPVVAKLREEIAELEAHDGDRTVVADELGDVLFTVVNLARHLDIDPEVALRRASDKFVDRFRRVEQIAAERNVTLDSLGLSELDGLWNEAKGG